VSTPQRNSIEFKLWGRQALFTDPLTRIGGEKCSYHLPTYEALKGVVKSIYWKPTLIWIVDAVRVIKRIQTRAKGTKPLNFSGGNSLAFYTFLVEVEYQVRAHFEWNLNQPDLERDRNEGKHSAIAQRSLERGGRQDIFLGTRDCQGYVEPCRFGEGEGAYDHAGELAFGLMFHGFDYPDESGGKQMEARFWFPTLIDGVLRYERPEHCPMRKEVRPMTAKRYGVGTSLRDVEAEFAALEG
jgi:CRISPR-associated protein Cas5d